MDHRSLWQKTLSDPVRVPSLQVDLKCDAVVVGAGLTGILTAWMLQKQGFDVVVLDSGSPGQGASGCTTAKITSLHGFFYSNLISTLGLEPAKLYFHSNQSAIERYCDLIETQNISCDFRTVDCFLYTRSSPSAIHDELSALKALGAAPHFTTETQLPFPISASLRLENQAIFHPLKLISALLPHLRVYGNSTVKKICGSNVITEHFCVTAKHIVIATRYPFFLVPGLFFSRMHQERSYALSITNIPPIDDMYIDADQNGVTFRPWKNQVILSGFTHRTGHAPVQAGYDSLHLCAQRWYPGHQPTAQWSTEDCIPADHIPYIGSYENGNARLYVATGFQKWGMSAAMVSAEILTDSICGRKNKYAALFSPHRFPNAKAIGNILRDGAISCENLARQIFFVPRTTFQQIPPGQGGIVQWKGCKAGVFHHPNGKYYFVSTRCPHMGCQLSWNCTENTWDCPCHGSRFSYDGTRLDPPAKTDLPCTCRKA